MVRDGEGLRDVMAPTDGGRLSKSRWYEMIWWRISTLVIDCATIFLADQRTVNAGYSHTCMITGLCPRHSSDSLSRASASATAVGCLHATECNKAVGRRPYDRSGQNSISHIGMGMALICRYELPYRRTVRRATNVIQDQSYMSDNVYKWFDDDCVKFRPTVCLNLFRIAGIFLNRIEFSLECRSVQSHKHMLPEMMYFGAFLKIFHPDVEYVTQCLVSLYPLIWRPTCILFSATFAHNAAKL